MGFASSGTPIGSMPPELVERWEAAYSRYDGGDLHDMADVSAAVGTLWREMATAVPGSPWWLVAALVTAAEAFEAQSRDWAGRQRARTDGQVRHLPGAFDRSAQGLGR
ncbi:hypothetical protein SAMN04487818_107466 [Actinokineospora terrae]|uniref:Uncharacterized protein n=2 Tax=Actinokineospora terrae TaxID=155974 RepID=A0A1H9UTL6_9PSEU|nr:hypothetical protein SAMN04487818_107466 [Actinokineospora terrae]